jgi:hypothetical protein
MRKAQFLTVFWTLFIAIPLTALALSLAALLTENLTEIAAGLNYINVATSVAGRGWASEIAQRWPEVAGMIVGQLVIMAILIFARRSRMVEDKKLQ